MVRWRPRCEISGATRNTLFLVSDLAGRGSVNQHSRRNNLRCLVTVADDFGKSQAINRVVAEACDDGILTAASLMADGWAFEDALRIAGERDRLSIGLHVTLCDGCAMLPHSKIPGLTSYAGFFGGCEKMNERVLRKMIAGCYGALSSSLHLTFILFTEEAWT